MGGVSVLGRNAEQERTVFGNDYLRQLGWVGAALQFEQRKTNYLLAFFFCLPHLVAKEENTIKNSARFTLSSCISKF